MVVKSALIFKAVYIMYNAYMQYAMHFTFGIMGAVVLLYMYMHGSL